MSLDHESPEGRPVAIPVFADKRIRAWPKHPKGGAATYLALADALSRDFPTDAHFAAYSVPAIERRLSLDALRQPEARAQVAGGVPMVLVVFDVDCEAAHLGDVAGIDTWWLDETEKVLSLLVRHPGAFVYRTRGGYRIVYRLAEPIVLREDADAEAWSVRYCAWVACLKREFDVTADPACKDWPRLFRLPHATREVGGAPERREEIGDPKDIGSWVCQPSAADQSIARRASKRKRRSSAAPAEECPVPPAPSEGVLYHLFRARDWLGSTTGRGNHAVVCPNEAAHTCGERLDTSTVLYGPGPGEVHGWLHCSHAHCQGRTLRDVLDAFTEAEIAAAREAAGLGTVSLDDDPESDEGALARGTPAMPARAGPRKTDVLVHGAHFTGEKIGTDDFTREVLEAVPEGVLCRMDRIVGRLVGPRGQMRFIRLEVDDLRQIIDAHTRLGRIEPNDRGEPKLAYKACARDYAALVLAAAATSPRVRALRVIANYPVYLPGFELARPGWNADDGVYYDEPADLEGLTPRAERALEVLADLVVDFPFADDASRANAFGAMLTRVLRPAIGGPIPFHFYLAALERTGKGKLIDVSLGLAIGGAALDLIQLTDREEEREKRIFSLVIAGVSAVHGDNVASAVFLDSPALASLATAWPNVRGRILGVSEVPLLPNAAVWVFSGNNVSATGELVKRTVPIRLQPKDEHPELRTDFVHPDCHAYARERRRAVLEALLGLVDAWKAAGRPAPGVAMGGFERWVEAVGGCLVHAGATAWMSNYRHWLTSADDTQVDAEVLVKAWAARHGSAVVTAAQLFPLVEETGAFRWVLAKKTEAGQLVAFGRSVLKPLTDRPVAGWIVRRGTSGSSATYSLEPWTGPSAPAGPSDPAEAAEREAIRGESEREVRV